MHRDCSDDNLIIDSTNNVQVKEERTFMSLQPIHPKLEGTIIKRSRQLNIYYILRQSILFVIIRLL